MINVLLLTLGLMAAASDAAGAGGETKPKTKPETKPEAEVKTKLVKVLVASLFEDGVDYAKDATFTTTAERAAALGDSVQLV